MSCQIWCLNYVLDISKESTILSPFPPSSSKKNEVMIINYTSAIAMILLIDKCTFYLIQRLPKVKRGPTLTPHVELHM